MVYRMVLKMTAPSVEGCRPEQICLTVALSLRNTAFATAPVAALTLEIELSKPIDAAPQTKPSVATVARPLPMLVAPAAVL